MEVPRVRVAKIENGQSVALEVERVHLRWAPQAAEFEGGCTFWFCCMAKFWRIVVAVLFFDLDYGSWRHYARGAKLVGEILAKILKCLKSTKLSTRSRVQREEFEVGKGDKGRLGDSCPPSPKRYVKAIERK